MIRFGANAKKYQKLTPNMAALQGYAAAREASSC